MAALGLGLEAKSTTGFGDSIRELQQIWTEIGESEEDMDSMVLELERECRKIYQKKIEEASRARAFLHQSVAAKEAEVASLVAVLDERNLQRKMEKLSLKELLASVDPLLENLREMREERLRQFAEVLSQIEKIKAEIEGFSYPHPPTNDVKIKQDDLSVRKLTEYQLQLKALQKDKSDRLQKVLEFVNEIYSLCGLLEVDFRKTVDSVHPSLHDNGGKHSTNISDSTLEGLSQTVLKLETEKKIRKEKLFQVAESLLDLWNLMETPHEEKKYYRETESIVGSLEHDIGCSGIYSLETIEKMEGEVERLTNLKATRMRELVLIRRTELEEICRTTHIEPDTSTAPENVSALIDSGIVNSSELLASIEMQISKAKEETIVRKEIMDRVNKWLVACTEENWLEDYDQDPNKYIAGRGFHLNLKRAEKARAIVSKIPDMVDKLMNKIFVWENERQMPFLYDGVSLVSILEEYKLLRQQKEELKRRYREQRKLQNMFLKGKETVYGSKWSSRRNTNFRGKPNANGSMNSAIPELFLLHSRSRDSDAYSKEIRHLSCTSLNFPPMSREDTASLFTSITSSEPESPPFT
ncbi:65-kDa microtubule-associated protein 6-like [Zingiber officinale]|uniref:65-kDa microtubule-associated protein 6-like n=1 Tax=Zingiber officinale TaxID=94328 RepID=UPI001C4BE3F3|nr:65-kDa microtubule-associated protein 6-like [Zingiber officinale]